VRGGVQGIRDCSWGSARPLREKKHTEYQGDILIASDDLLHPDRIEDHPFFHSPVYKPAALAKTVPGMEADFPFIQGWDTDKDRGNSLLFSSLFKPGKHF
jgi:hypothetical protein